MKNYYMNKKFNLKIKKQKLVLILINVLLLIIPIGIILSGMWKYYQDNHPAYIIVMFFGITSFFIILNGIVFKDKKG